MEKTIKLNTLSKEFTKYHLDYEAFIIRDVEEFNKDLEAINKGIHFSVFSLPVLSIDEILIDNPSDYRIYKYSLDQREYDRVIYWYVAIKK